MKIFEMRSITLLTRIFFNAHVPEQICQILWERICHFEAKQHWLCRMFHVENELCPLADRTMKTSVYQTPRSDENIKLHRQDRLLHFDNTLYRTQTQSSFLYKIKNRNQRLESFWKRIKNASHSRKYLLGHCGIDVSPAILCTVTDSKRM